MKHAAVPFVLLLCLSYGAITVQAFTDAEMAQAEQELIDARRALIDRPNDPLVKQTVAVCEARLTAMKGGSGGNGRPNPAQPEPPKKPVIQMQPDPRNPWSIPGAMWSQLKDGSYVYHRLQKMKDGRNQVIDIEPSVSKDGKLTWTDKKK